MAIMMKHRTPKWISTPRQIFARIVAVILAMVCTSSLALAGPIHSDVAFSPRKGGSMLRLQFTYFEADGRGGAVQNVHGSVVRAVFIHGVSEKLALIAAFPYVNKKIDMFSKKMGRFENAQGGFADFNVMLKYRFWQDDSAARHTERFAGLLGLNVRSGDSDLSSDSYDPIFGTVYSWRQDRHLFDANLIYQINTGSGENRHDRLRYDIAYSYRWISPADDDEMVDVWYEWNLIAELNGYYLTDSTHEIFLSPGVQYVTEKWVGEFSVQFPVVQELTDQMSEMDFRIVAGIRIRF